MCCPRHARATAHSILSAFWVCQTGPAAWVPKPQAGTAWRMPGMLLCLSRAGNGSAAALVLRGCQQTGDTSPELGDQESVCPCPLLSLAAQAGLCPSCIPTVSLPPQVLCQSMHHWRLLTPACSAASWVGKLSTSQRLRWMAGVMPSLLSPHHGCPWLCLSWCQPQGYGNYTMHIPGTQWGLALVPTMLRAAVAVETGHKWLL